MLKNIFIDDSEQSEKSGDFAESAELKRPTLFQTSRYISTQVLNGLRSLLVWSRSLPVPSIQTCGHRDTLGHIGKVLKNYRGDWKQVDVSLFKKADFTRPNS